MAHYDPSNTVPMAGIATTSEQDAQTATGSTQATAFAITKAWTIFTTVASNTGTVLPVVPGGEFTILNLGANTLKVYPPVGGAINGGSANASINVVAGNGVRVKCISATRFVAVSDDDNGS